MSARSIRRNHERMLATETRRNSRRAKRAGIAAGAALGATVMFAPSAGAASFEVNTLADTPPDGCTTTADGCTLREAVQEANASTEDDTITFAPTLSGTIILTQGQINVDSNYGDSTTIVDDGTAEVGVSGNGASRVFGVYSDLTISGLDMTDGYTGGNGGALYVDAGPTVALSGLAITDSYSGSSGGGISVDRGDLQLNNTQVSGNATDDDGGGIHLDNEYFKYGAGRTTLELNNSEVSGNSADFGYGGGIFGDKYSEIEANDSEISGNTSDRIGGGVLSRGGYVDVASSLVSGNTADGGGGGVATKYADLEVTDSEISGNDGAGAGGVLFMGAPFYREGDGGHRGEIRRSTVADNTARYGAGGLGAVFIGEDSSFVVSQSTISGNEAGTAEDPGPYAPTALGGGMAVYGPVYGEVLVSNSTISGNVAENGGGVSIDGLDRRPARRETPPESDGSIELNNSTIADNSASEAGGGVYLGYYVEYEGGGGSRDSHETRHSQVLPLSSTIVADNTAGGTANDLAEAPDTEGGGFLLNYSLIETPAGATTTQDPAGSSILGVDPQLGNLADNGGPTLTHLPAQSSPVVDQGVDNETARDQRGERRSIDLAPDNNPAGDPTDIGAVELQTGQGPEEPETRPLNANEIPAACDLTLASAGLALGGTDEGQTILGSDEDDILRGFGGSDTVVGKAGDDCLTGDEDKDTLRGKSGADLALGGKGVDFVKGNGGDDDLRGNGGEDRVKGAGGDDTVKGGGGDDNVAAGNGDDKVRGNAGDDRLFGNDGNDNIKAGGGNDVIFGGGGNNKINCGSGKDKVVVQGGKDQIANNCETVKDRGKKKNKK